LDYRDIQLTDSARQVLALARDEAHRLRHEYIGTEHLVLALTRQTQGFAVTALHNLHIDVEGVRETIEASVHPGAAASSPAGTLPYTSRTQKVFRLARESALTFDQGAVGAEHLLLGVLREAKGMGGQVLLHHGLSEDAAFDEIKRMNSAAGASPP
jgi:ATP-dependent Clp protease ATP-binding subunit ClpC